MNWFARLNDGHKMKNKDIRIVQGWPEDLEAMAAFLDSNWDYDSIGAGMLGEKLHDDPMADSGLCFTAMAGELIAGMLYCVQRDIRGQRLGYVKLMAVGKPHRRRGLGSRLYERAEGLLKQSGVTAMRWYDVPLNYFMPGLDPRYTPAYCFALRHGFKQVGEAVNMLAPLQGKDWSTGLAERSLQERGVEVRRAGEADLPALRDLLSQEWALWNNEVDMAMRDSPPSVHIALKNNRIIAFSVHNGNNKGSGWFGPMGTHPDARGLGVGNVLLKRCLQDMQDQGHRQAIIPWVAPVAFYAHYVDASIDRVFWRMEKTIQ